MKFMSKVSPWSSLILALVVLIVLTGINTQAQNQTISGHLQVTGDTSLSGALNVTGVAELNSNVTNFGSNGANAATPGLVLTYTDTASGTISTITLATSGTSALWQWERNSANGLLPQMTLTGTNSIILWNPTVSNSAGILLNPAGDSTFSGSITATGTNSRLPNQQITTDTASVLTVGLADSRFMSASSGGTATYSSVQVNTLTSPTTITVNSGAPDGTWNPDFRITGDRNYGTRLEIDNSNPNSGTAWLGFAKNGNGIWSLGYGSWNLADQSGPQCFRIAAPSGHFPLIIDGTTDYFGFGLGDSVRPTEMIEARGNIKATEGNLVVGNAGFGLKIKTGISSKNWDLRSFSNSGVLAFEYNGEQAPLSISTNSITVSGELNTTGNITTAGKLIITGANGTRIAPQGDLSMGEFTTEPSQ